jgi:hypothetical protein
MIKYFFLGDILLSSVQSSYLAAYPMVTLSLIYFMFYLNPDQKDKEKVFFNKTLGNMSSG